MRNEPMRRNELPETCFSILPSSGQLIIIRCGERGYYPSEWDTGNREENREIASSHNVRRGITDIQEAAMLAGSMFGWNTPGANPQWYLDNARYVNSNIVQGHIKDPIMSVYQRSYAGMYAKENSLEHLWIKHNSDHRPFAHRMRSLSVSDIVVLTQGGKKTAYYADSIGFKEVPEFLAQQRVQKKHKERGEAR